MQGPTGVDRAGELMSRKPVPAWPRVVLAALAVAWVMGPPVFLLSQAYRFVTFGGWMPLTHGEQTQAEWFLVYWAGCFLVAPVLGLLTAVATRHQVAAWAFAVALAVSLFFSFADGTPWMLKAPQPR